MAKNIFTEAQLEQILSNPYVIAATERRITYTTDFKKKFIEEYRLGKGPREIFKDAGFDVDALGYKRIERASDRWRTENNEGKLGDQVDYVEVHRERRRHAINLKDQLSEQAELIWKLQMENNQLRERIAHMSEA